MRRHAALMLMVAVLSSCANPEKKHQPPHVDRAPKLQEITFSKLPNWESADVRAGLNAFKKACSRFFRLDPSMQASKAWPELGTNGDWALVCKRAKAVDGPDGKSFLKSQFRVYEVNSPANSGLFTGYFEPEFYGARQRGGRYQYPLYKRPKDIISVDLGMFSENLEGQLIQGRLEEKTLKPYYERSEIAEGALQGRELELVWLSDPIDGFFIEIQGSGRIRLAGGDWMRVGYDGKNGRPYRAIGRDLIAMGEIPSDKMSMSAIRNWLSANPSRSQALMNKNPSYVFFKERHGAGPIGAAGTALTPGYSLAVDPRFVPLASIVYLDASHPSEGMPRLQRLVAAEDTGSAIKGPQRGDLFWGTGKAAGENAGHMASKGRYYLLSPR
jgi:membrane-bound lytic murein transglycosylase A